VPAVIVGLVILAWLLLAGLPFGGREEDRASAKAATETIAEGTTTARNEPITGTVIEVPGGDDPLLTETGTTQTSEPPGAADAPTAGGTAGGNAGGTAAPPASTPRVVEEPAGRTAPAPRTTPTPAPRQVPVPARTAPAPPPRRTPAPAVVRTVPPPPPAPAPSQNAGGPGGGEISDSQAAATLRSYITSNSYYAGVSGDCVQVRSQGYSNVGYTYAVWDGCVTGGGSRMLGRWRVDSKTREVFRQREDGRYLRP
jgi:hypothetical protein